MQIRRKYDKAEELNTTELKEAYAQVRVKYALMGIELPEHKIKEEPEPKILKVHRPV